MYADDTTLYSSLENFDSNNIEREINYELEKVNLWLKANKLSLNVKKTKCMFFHKRKTLPHINLSLNDVIIENVPKFNYLGIFLFLDGMIMLKSNITLHDMHLNGGI